MKKSSKESIIEHVSLGRKLSKFIGEEIYLSYLKRGYLKIKFRIIIHHKIKNVKCIEVNPTKYIQGLYSMKTSLRETEEDSST